MQSSRPWRKLFGCVPIQFLHLHYNYIITFAQRTVPIPWNSLFFYLFCHLTPYMVNQNHKNQCGQLSPPYTVLLCDWEGGCGRVLHRTLRQTKDAVPERRHSHWLVSVWAVGLIQAKLQVLLRLRVNLVFTIPFGHSLKTKITALKNEREKESDLNPIHLQSEHREKNCQLIPPS